MRSLERNKQTLYYSLYSTKTDKVVDGKKTGEKTITYATPVLLKANVSSSKGTAQEEWFGTSLNYDKVIVTTDTTLSVDENSVFWVDVPLVSGTTQNKPDYKVVRVSKSINSVSIALQRVER